MSNQAHMLTLLQTPNPTPQQRHQLLTLLIANGIDMPDTRFENAFLLYQANPGSDQSLYHGLQVVEYLQQEEMVYNGLQLKLDKTLLKKFVINMKKKIGDTTYIRRLTRFVQFVTGGGEDATGMQDLLRDDLTDNETYKKTIASFKKSGRIDQYIDKMNKYLSIEPLDEQAWLQLAQIYGQKGHYMKSAFCYEQLMILNPSNDTYALRLSQLYLTLNNKTTTEKAIKYLSYLVAKRPNNLRALWVLYRAVVGNQEYQDLKEMCFEVINKLYSQKNAAIKINLAL